MRNIDEWIAARRRWEETERVCSEARDMFLRAEELRLDAWRRLQEAAAALSTDEEREAAKIQFTEEKK